MTSAAAPSNIPPVLRPANPPGRALADLAARAAQRTIGDLDGVTVTGITLATGDLQPGDVCISIGTSGVASTVSTASVHDGTGMVTGFADATGRYLPLACTLNGAKVLDFAARILGIDLNGLSALALEGELGAHGVSLLPYFDG